MAKRNYLVGMTTVLLAAAGLSGCSSSPPAAEQPVQQSQSEAPAAPAEPVEPEGNAEPRSEDPAEETAEGVDSIGGSDWSSEVPRVEGSANPDGPGLLFHDVRVGDHQDFYRVVFEFTGSGEPGYFGMWSDQPVEQGRGEPLPAEGENFLDLYVTGIGIPMTDEDYENYYSGPQVLEVGPLSVAVDGTFEGQAHFAIGMDGQREFQIGRLQDPARVVVDVRK